MKEEERFTLKILITFALAMVFILGTIFFVINHQLGSEIAEEWTDTFKGVEKTFPAELRLDADSMDAVLHAVVEDEMMRDALRRKDRDALLKKAQPLFRSLLSQHGITHFYFTGTDRVNILRVHAPERFGDTINRFATLEAEKTGKPAWGIEVGPLGTFTLRVVFPWFEGERLIGYVELGREIDRVLEEIQERYTVGLLVFMRKELLKRKDWEEGMRMFGKEPDWERFPSVVNTAGVLKVFPQELLDASARSQKSGAMNGKVISVDNRRYSVGNIPLIDAGGNEVGYMALFKDRTDAFALRQRLIAIIGIIILTVATVLSVIFYIVLRRVEIDLKNSRMNLANSNNELVEKTKVIERQLKGKEHIYNELEETQDASLNIMFDLGREVEERKKAEEILRVKEEEIRSLLDNSQEVVQRFDRQLNRLYVNPVIERYTGIPYKEFLGKTDWELGLPENTIVLWEKAAQILFETGKEQIVEFEFPAPHGNSYFESHMMPEFGTEGTVISLLSITRDITERKRMEMEVLQLNAELEQKVIVRTAALEHARLELEQANRGKDEFLAAISHELKTPLNHILGFADLLKEGLAGELSAEQKEMAQDIFDAGNRELAIVNSLIELARLQVGKVKLQAEPQDPAKLLAEIATRYAAKAEASGLAFAVELTQDLGEMQLDRRVVTNVLDQLLANAFKFTPSGGRISLTARRVPHTEVAAPVRIEAGEYLELAVADNGPGIAPDILPRLFQSFVQGDGRLNRSHGGTGVGLVLVRLLAELHGGGSGVQSEPGAGAKFLVWLPYAAAEMEAASSQPPATLPQA